ncbi:hypothetical protein AK812_SmicGene20067 [Symbiodinium microadriaticum]|uniref:Uncharacterized protein n=1 Tax=Symbiodinium microadriaticum TaxID=2951 RepID=A0A1Q9DQV0_SYMMI|nr:hypothetical protein AK812_SmicGene20067 [Symbiodinium microadriaticum]
MVDGLERKFFECLLAVYAACMRLVLADKTHFPENDVIDIVSSSHAPKKKSSEVLMNGCRVCILAGTSSSLRSILETVAPSTDRTSDPVLEDKCCLWHGDIKAAKDTKHAAIRLIGQGEEGAL